MLLPQNASAWSRSDGMVQGANQNELTDVTDRDPFAGIPPIAMFAAGWSATSAAHARTRPPYASIADRDAGSLLGADGGWSGDPRHSASRTGSAGRRTPPAPPPAR